MAKELEITENRFVLNSRIFKNFEMVFFLFFTLFFVLGCRENDEYHNLKLNQVQVIGSHNSYKVGIEKDLLNIIFNEDSSMAYSLQYEHLSITEQLDLGLRNLEVDLFYDPEGGHFNNPKGLEILKTQGIESMPFDAEHKLDLPGLKVFHIQEIDFRSHNLLFKDLLTELNQWSDSHKEHIPVFITINAKDGAIDKPGFRKPIPFTGQALDSIDIEIKSVLPGSKLITPDLVKAGYSSLEEAVTKHGWPSIDSVKGRFLFVLDETGNKLSSYLNPDGSLFGKVMFVNSYEGNPSAAIRIVNDPVKNEDYIQALVKKGYIVRTRSDADTREARSNNYTRFEKAQSSGAQIITTDYYMKSSLFNSNYKVIFDNNTYTRVNPVFEI